MRGGQAASMATQRAGKESSSPADQKNNGAVAGKDGSESSSIKEGMFFC